MKSYSIFLGLQLLALSGASWAADSNNKFFFLKCLLQNGDPVVFPVEMPSDASIAQVKQEAISLYNNELSTTVYAGGILLWAGNDLQDDKTLADYNLGLETTICFVPQMGQGNYAGNAYEDPTSSDSALTFGDFSDNEINWSDGE